MLRRPAAVALACVVMAGALAACSAGTGHRAAPTVSSSVATLTTARVSTPATRTTPARRPTPKPTLPSDHQLPSGAAQNQIAVPALGVSAPIDTPCVSANGEISPPSTDPRRTCIWAGGAPLGATKGTAMILGHVNYSGVDGALGRIGTLHAGDRIYIWNSAKSRSIWAVTAIHQRAKADGVDPGAEVGAEGPARMVLVTCGGAWIGGHFGYADLIWVYARPY